MEFDSPALRHTLISDLLSQQVKSNVPRAAMHWPYDFSTGEKQMFKPKTFPLEHFAKVFPERIASLEAFLDDKTIVYVDYGNVRGWKKRLNWEVDLKKLKDLFESFGVLEVRFYFGTNVGDSGSERFMTAVHKMGYKMRTKRIKRMDLSIDVTSISRQSPDILNNFIKDTLLKNLRIETIQYLNDELRAMNKQGKMSLECWKSNFDVEIASDMRLDHLSKRAEKFCLISGDSDFADPLEGLLNDHRAVCVIATARHIATELSMLQNLGLKIFDIKTLREFIQKTA